MADPTQKQKSENAFLREEDDFELPTGIMVEVPIDMPIEKLMADSEWLRRYWAAHHFDESAAIASKNPERFEM